MKPKKTLRVTQERKDEAGSFDRDLRGLGGHHLFEETYPVAALVVKSTRPVSGTEMQEIQLLSDDFKHRIEVSSLAPHTWLLLPLSPHSGTHPADAFRQLAIACELAKWGKNWSGYSWLIQPLHSHLSQASSGRLLAKRDFGAHLLHQPQFKEGFETFLREKESTFVLHALHMHLLGHDLNDGKLIHTLDSRQLIQSFEKVLSEQLGAEASIKKVA
jgi:hypothetical protein